MLTFNLAIFFILLLACKKSDLCFVLPSCPALFTCPAPFFHYPSSCPPHIADRSIYGTQISQGRFCLHEQRWTHRSSLPNIWRQALIQLQARRLFPIHLRDPHPPPDTFSTNQKNIITYCRHLHRSSNFPSQIWEDAFCALRTKWFDGKIWSACHVNFMNHWISGQLQ